MRSILLIDDDPTTIQILTKALRIVGFSVDAAHDGGTAISCLRVKAFDVIILDITMPGMDGIEVLRRIRSDPNSKALPVVIYSALDSPRTREEAEGLGICDYWIKTMIDLKQMRDRLHEICNNH